MTAADAIVWPVAFALLLTLLVNFLVTTRKEKYQFDRLPGPLALLKLAWTRKRMWRKNLYPLFPEGAAPKQPERFGRNFDPRRLRAGRRSLYTPLPGDVSDALLARRDSALVPARGLNYLAAAWIHFQAHNWAAHERDYGAALDVRPERGWGAPATRLAAPLPGDERFGRCPVFANRGSGNRRGWDASQVYGYEEGGAACRTYSGGLIREDDDEDEARPHTPVDRSWWLGAELLRWLFVREHNAVARAIAAAHPLMEDGELFVAARAVVTALMAKIHAAEWAPAALDSPCGRVSASAGWRGLVPGLAASCCSAGGCGDTDGRLRFGDGRDAPPFFMTEEFVSAMRLHSMMRDTLPVPPLPGATEVGGDGSTVELRAEEVLGAGAGEAVRRFGVLRVFSAFGNCHPGALRLRNYPTFLRNLCVVDAEGQEDEEAARAWRTDLAALDVLRDRERAVPRFNAFRTALGLRPVHSFREFDVDRDTLAALEEVYEGDVDRVDAVVGMLAERRPRGHLFGNTAFLLFSAMSSRRMASCALLGEDYHAGTFTAVGLKWVEGATMGAVLRRHLPGVERLMRGCEGGNAFTPWRTHGQQPQ